MTEGVLARVAEGLSRDADSDLPRMRMVRMDGVADLSFGDAEDMGPHVRVASLPMLTNGVHRRVIAMMEVPVTMAEDMLDTMRRHSPSQSAIHRACSLTWGRMKMRAWPGNTVVYATWVSLGDDAAASGLLHLARAMLSTAELMDREAMR